MPIPDNPRAPFGAKQIYSEVFGFLAQNSAFVVPCLLQGGRDFRRRIGRCRQTSVQFSRERAGEARGLHVTVKSAKLAIATCQFKNLHWSAAGTRFADHINAVGSHDDVFRQS